MALSGTTQIADLIPEIWSANIYANLKKQLPMGTFFSRDYEGEISQRGDTVNINELANPTAEDLTTDTDNFSTEVLSTTKTQLVADRRASVAYEFTDLAQLQSLSFEQSIRDNMSYALAKKIEDYIESLIAPSTSSPDHVVTSATSNTFAIADAGTLRQLLSTQGVPMVNRALFLTPDFYAQALAVESIGSKDYIPAGSPTSSGTISNQVMGFTVSEINNSAETYTAYAAHRSAIQLVLQTSVRIQISNLHASKKYGFVISGDIVYGAKQIANKRIVEMTGS